MDDSEITPLLETLLNILGKIILTCAYDTGNKPLCESKSLVLLTQSHSSSLAQEIINLLRFLHGLVGWNQVLNAILMNKLNLAAYLLSEDCLMTAVNDCHTTDQQQYVVTACLNVIGAWDTRPRIGSVAEIENAFGTVVRVTQKGKLCLLMHDGGDVKRVPLNNLKMIEQPSFNLDRMPLGENLTKIWASLLASKQNNYMGNNDRKYVYGKYKLHWS